MDILENIVVNHKSWISVNDQKMVMTERIGKDIWEEAIQALPFFRETKALNLEVIFSEVRRITGLNIVYGKRYTANGIGNNACYEVILREGKLDTVIGGIYMNYNMFGSYIVGIATINMDTEDSTSIYRLGVFNIK